MNMIIGINRQGIINLKKKISNLPNIELDKSNFEFPIYPFLSIGLNIFIQEDIDLSKFTTKLKDFKKGINRKPSMEAIVII